MTGAPQFFAQLAIVVDFAVVDDDERPDMHGLRAGVAQLDDREPPVRQSEWPIGEEPLAVRPPVRQRRGERGQESAAVEHSAGINITANTAHEDVARACRSWRLVGAAPSPRATI